MIYNQIIPHLTSAAYVKPYVLSIQPGGTMPSSSLEDNSDTLAGSAGLVQAPVLHVQSSITHQPVQSLVLPNAETVPSSLRLICPSPSAKAPAFVVSTPNEKATAISEGSTVWILRMRTWSEQVDELVEGGRYSEALSLLDTIEPASLADHVGP